MIESRYRILLIDNFNKEAKKLYFMHYPCVVIILFSVGLCKSAFCSYSHVKQGLCLFVFWFFVFLYLSLFIFFGSMIWFRCRLKRLNKIIQSIMDSLILFSLYTSNLLKHNNCVIKSMLPERNWKLELFKRKFSFIKKNKKES